MDNFRDYWKLQKGEMSVDEFSDKRLTVPELKQVRDVIAQMQSKNLPSSKIIEALQHINKKLMEKWRAERAYFTEVKRDDTIAVAEASEELDVHKYRVVLSPNACDICVKKFSGKIFKSNQIEKNGQPIIPAHPNCYCILIPEV